MNVDRSKLERLATDLRTQEPRSGQVKLAGFEGAARAVDKCRASLLGIEGEYRFGCPLDQAFFHEAGISANEFQTVVARGASDQEIEQWLRENAHSNVMR